jgi:hypothetical protein
MPNTHNVSIQTPDTVTTSSDKPITVTIEHAAHRPRRVRRRFHTGKDRVIVYSGTLPPLAPNLPIPLPPPPATVTVAMAGFSSDAEADKNITFKFTHWTVTGVTSVTGPLTEKDPVVQGEDTNILATAWYGGFGGGPGTNAIVLDCWDYDTGQYVDDDFVTVNPSPLLPSGSRATDDANLGDLVTDGWLPNIQACKIVANPSVGSGTFLLWNVYLKTVPTISVEPNSPPTLDVTRGAEAFADAWYKKPEEVDECLVLRGQVLALISDLKRLGFHTISSETIELRRKIAGLSLDMDNLGCPQIPAIPEP